MKDADIIATIEYESKKECNAEGKVIVDSNIFTKSENDILAFDLDVIVEVKSIEKVKNAYQIKQKKVYNAIVYNVIVDPVSDKKSKYGMLNILSVERKNKNKLSKIKIGQQYKLRLIPYFNVDKSYTHYRPNIIIGDIGILGFTIKNGDNIFTSPNIEGLYYVPNGIGVPNQ